MKKTIKYIFFELFSDECMLKRIRIIYVYMIGCAVAAFNTRCLLGLH